MTDARPGTPGAPQDPPRPGPPAFGVPGGLLDDLAALNAAWLRSESVQPDAYEALLTLARQRDDVPSETQAIADYGRYLIARQGDQAALDMFRAAYAHALARPHEPARIARILNGLGTVERRLDHLDDALAHLSEAYRLAQSHGSPDLVFPILNNLASFQLWAGEPTEALRLHLEAQQLATQTANPTYCAANIVNRMAVHVALSENEQVLALYDEFTHLTRDTPQADDFGPGALLEYSRSLLALGHTQAALEHARLGLEGIGERNVLSAAPALHLVNASALRQLGRLPEALDCARQALACAERGRHRTETLRAHQELGVLYQETGDLALAVPHLQAALTLVQAHQDQAVHARTHAYRAVSRLHHLELEMRAAEARSEELARDNEELQRRQLALHRQVTHDALTGLLQREAFREQVGRWLGALLPGQHAAMLFIDLDDFKSVNDLYGHQFGDRLLCKVAERLTAAVPEHALVARMGGDEFMVFLPPPMDVTAVQTITERVLSAIRVPFTPDGHVVEITASAGYALAPDHSLNPATLQRQADLAMYHAKHTARGGLRAFTALMQEAHEERLHLERQMQGALGRGEFSLHYQGRFDAPSRTLRGFEALMRWRNPAHGQVTPGKFIPLAERTGLIVTLGRWALREACTQAERWHFPQRQLLMSVNVSPLQFEHPSFVADVRAALAGSGLPGQYLVLELTESLVLRDPAGTRDTIDALRELGVQVALDDFGQGYSSLSLLQDLHFDHLKIDRSFIRSLDGAGERHGKARILLETMLHLAWRLNTRVTAEGVETNEQLELLTALGCDDVQGFLLARPVSADDAQTFLTAPHPPARPDAGNAGAG